MDARAAGDEPDSRTRQGRRETASACPRRTREVGDGGFLAEARVSGPGGPRQGGRGLIPIDAAPQLPGCTPLSTSGGDRPAGSIGCAVYWVARPPGPLDHTHHESSSEALGASAGTPRLCRGSRTRESRPRATVRATAFADIAAMLERLHACVRRDSQCWGASLRSGHAPPRWTPPRAGPPRVPIEWLRCRRRFFHSRGKACIYVYMSSLLTARGPRDACPVSPEQAACCMRLGLCNGCACTSSIYMRVRRFISYSVEPSQIRRLDNP